MQRNPTTQFDDELPPGAMVSMEGHNNPPSEAEIIRQRLAENYIDDEATLNRLLSREVPEELTTDKDAGALNDFLFALRAHSSRVGEIHKKEKQPFLEAGRVADDWRAERLRKLDGVISIVGKALLAWNKKKQEEERKRQEDAAEKLRQDALELAEQAKVHEDAGIVETAQDLNEAAQQSENHATLMQRNLHQVKGRSAGTMATSSNKKEWVGVIENLAGIDLEALRPYLKEEDIEAALKRAVKNGVRSIGGAKIFQQDVLNTRKKR